ncbi:unnamed protein product, partial [Sphacelaria rigidula]
DGAKRVSRELREGATKGQQATEKGVQTPQALEEREGPLTREVVVTSVRKRFESALFKQELAKGKKASPGDQALAVKGHPGKPNGPHRKGKPGKTQNPGRTGDGGQGKNNQSQASSSENQSGAATPWRCHVCQKMTTHRARDCPERRCVRCGKRGHSLIDCQ